MKKLFLIIAIFIGISVAANAQSTTSVKSEKVKSEALTTKKAETTNVRGNFVDKDNDGVCDNYQMRGKNKDCPNFVDANNDGICDNYKAKGNCCGNGGCKGHNHNHGRHHHGKGHCCGNSKN